MLVHCDSYDKAVSLAVQQATRYEAGDPLQDATGLSPLASAAQRDRVLSYVEKLLADGARPATGGPQPPDTLPLGYYVRPTVFADVRPDMVVATEEIFGSVLCVLPYETEQEATDIANGTPYGLAAAAWSADQDQAVAVARQLRAGRSRSTAGLQRRRAVRRFRAVGLRPRAGRAWYGGVPRGQGAPVLIGAVGHCDRELACVIGVCAPGLGRAMPDLRCARIPGI